MLLRNACRPAKPDLFGRIILMAEKTGHMETEGNEFFEADITDFLIPEDNGLHISSFLMMKRGLLLTS